MAKHEISVVFYGSVEVEVPDDLELDTVQSRELARRIALCKILATCDNPDAPADEAFSDWLSSVGLDDRHVEEYGPKWDEVYESTNLVSGGWGLQ